MLSFNKNKNPIIDLYDKEDFNDDYKLNKDITKPNETLYIDDKIESDSEDSDEKDKEDYLYIKNLNNFIPFPHIEKNKLYRFYIFGKSGIGKSTTLCNLIKMFLNTYDNDIFILYYTANNLDEPIVKYLKKIGNKNIMVITPQDFYIARLQRKILPYSVDYLLSKMKQDKKNRPILCCFDDFETLNDKTIKNLVDNFRDDILQRGRKRTSDTNNIHCINISHTGLQGHQSIKLFNESEYIICHLRSLSNSTIENILKIKCGYDDDIIKIVLDMKRKGAGITFIKSSYPFIIMNDKGILYMK